MRKTLINVFKKYFKFQTRLKMKKQKDLYMKYHPYPSQASLQNHLWPSTDRCLRPCIHMGDFTETSQALSKTVCLHIPHAEFLPEIRPKKSFTFLNNHYVFYFEIIIRLSSALLQSPETTVKLKESLHALEPALLPDVLTVLALPNS